MFIFFFRFFLHCHHIFCRSYRAFFFSTHLFGSPFFVLLFASPKHSREKKRGKKMFANRRDPIDFTSTFFFLFYLFFSLLNYAGSLENHLIAIQNFINRLFVLFINPHHVNTPNSLFLFFINLHIYFISQDFFFISSIEM